MATETGRTLDIAQEVTIAAPKETVFAALTQGIGAWWSHSFVPAPERIELEPWVGGRFHEVWGDGQGALYATVTRIRTPDLLYLNGTLGMGGAVVGVIHFDLAETAGGTRLQLTHRAIGDIDAETVANYTGGWTALLEGRLKPYVEGGQE